MRLNQMFRQRQIVESVGPPVCSIRTRKPSGPQLARSVLVAELLEQIGFSKRVIDIVSEPIIEELEGVARADVFVLGHLDIMTGKLGQWLIRVDDLIDPIGGHEEGNKALRGWCAEHGLDFRILGPADVRTPFLKNARMLDIHAGSPPDPLDPDLDVLLAIIDAPGWTQTTVRNMIAAMGLRGVPRDRAEWMIDSCVVWGFVGCDLSVAYGDDALIGPPNPEASDNNREDPILRILINARSA